MRTPVLSCSLVLILALDARAQLTLQKTVLVPIQINSVTLNPTSVTGGSQVAGIVTLNRAPSSNLYVILKSSSTSIAVVPAGITIPAGLTSATFIAQTYAVASNPNVVTDPPSVQISSQIGTATPVAATVTVLPPSLTGLTINPASVGGGGASPSGTVTLSGPAPSGGMTIGLAAEQTAAEPRLDLTTLRISSPITLPSQVTVPAGAPSATFVITTRPVSTSTVFNVTASWGAFINKTATLTVLPPDLAEVSVSPGSFPAGTSSTGKVTLTAPAPSEGFPVNLSTGRAYGGTTGTFAQCGDYPSVPAAVTVPAGATSATFTVTTYPGYGVFWLKAVSPTSSKSQPFWVDSPTFRPVVPSTVTGGTVVQGTIQLNAPAVPAACGHYILASSNPTYAQVAASIDMPPGVTQVPFTITTTALPQGSPSQTVAISVTGPLVNNGASAPAQYTVPANMTITP